MENGKAEGGSQAVKLRRAGDGGKRARGGKEKKKDEGNQMKNVEIREGRTRKCGGGPNQAGVRAVAHTRGPEHH